MPKDVLDRVRANPKAILEADARKAPEAAIVRPYRSEDEDENAEPTKALQRDDILRRSDGHVVIGADARGEDATLAVPPDANEAASSTIGSAIGDSLLHRQGSPLGSDGAFPKAHPHHGGVPGMASTAQMPYALGGPASSGMAAPWPAWSAGSSGPVQVGNPRQVGGAPSYTGGGTMQQPGAMVGGNVPTSWGPLQAPPAKSKISGQMILLFVVGVVCLAIFVTGVVLFATTKF